LAVAELSAGQQLNTAAESAAGKPLIERIAIILVHAWCDHLPLKLGWQTKVAPFQVNIPGTGRHERYRASGRPDGLVVSR